MKPFRLCHSLVLSILPVLALVTPETRADDVVLNEWNCVGSSRLVRDADSVLGSITGNGGNWIELLVIGDHLDMRGWQLQWAEIDVNVNDPKSPEDAVDGTDPWFGDTMVHQGIITLSNHPLWSDVRRGAIITICELHTIRDESNAIVVSGSSVAFDPANDDWWIHISTFSTAAMTVPDNTYVTTLTNIAQDGPGNFSVGDNDWVMRIVDAGNNEVQGPVGEATDSWPDAEAIGNVEGGSLEGPLDGKGGNPPTLAVWQAITAASPFYDDTGGTSFGAPNADFDDGTGSFVPIQDVTALRDWINMQPPAVPEDFRILRNGFDLTVSWLSELGFNYELQQSENLSDWATVGGSSRAGTGDEITFVWSGGGASPRRYLRLFVTQ